MVFHFIFYPNACVPFDEAVKWVRGKVEWKKSFKCLQFTVQNIKMERGTVRAIKIVYRINQKSNIQITLKFRLKCLLCFYGMQLFWSVHPWTGFTCFSLLIGFPGYCGKAKATKNVTHSLPFFYFPFSLFNSMKTLVYCWIDDFFFKQNFNQ